MSKYSYSLFCEELMKKYNINENDMQKMLGIFNALKDPTRLKIIFQLMSGRKNVGQLVDGVGMTQSAISHQLIFLKQYNLVSSVKDGNRVYYFISDQHVKDVVKLCLTHARED